MGSLEAQAGELWLQRSSITAEILMTWGRLARAEKSKGSESPGGSRKTQEDTGRPRRTQRDPGIQALEDLGAHAKRRQPADPGGTVKSQEKAGEASQRGKEDPG